MGVWLLRPSGRLNLPVNHHAAALVQTMAGRLGSTMREIADIEEFQQVLNDAKASSRPVVVQVSGTSIHVVVVRRARVGKWWKWQR
mgnify:CR=1 FL=1